MDKPIVKTLVSFVESSKDNSKFSDILINMFENQKEKYEPPRDKTNRLSVR